MGYMHTFLCDNEIKSVKQGAKYEFQLCMDTGLISAKKLKASGKMLSVIA